MTFIRIIIAAFMLWCFMPQAFADDAAPNQNIQSRQLLVPHKGAAAPSFRDDPSEWLRATQRNLYGSMAGSLRQMNGPASGTAAWTLMLISLGYGVFHAAGPGHGKTVISAWLLATENELKRGIFISFLSSIVQALSAIAIVSAVLFILGGAISATRVAAGILESASYALIGAMGLYLISTAFRHSPAAKTPLATVEGPIFVLDHHLHADDHDHSQCNHAHGPEPKDLAGDWSFTKAASMAFAIGIRPCTGAILVLLAAYPLGLYWAGVVSVFIMALGTFFTVSVIAAISVYSKHLARRMANRNSRIGHWLDIGLRVGGGAVVAILGGLLFWVSIKNGGMISG